jgi:hypothetical protein
MPNISWQQADQEALDHQDHQEQLKQLKAEAYKQFQMQQKAKEIISEVLDKDDNEIFNDSLNNIYGMANLSSRTNTECKFSIFVLFE